MGLVDARAPADVSRPTDVPAQRLRARVCGAVQGVGFRPFVFRLARDLGLAGWVRNDPRGVVMEVEAGREVLETFLQRLRTEAPPQAVIQAVEAEWLPAAGYTEFEIRKSEAAGRRTAVVLPDLATCDQCLEDVLRPGNRRYAYPFTNCTNCGPRFSIIRALPYDRPRTTMARFAMCPSCASEYRDPRNRRFHAQPNACPVCGPRLALWDAAGRPHASGRSPPAHSRHPPAPEPFAAPARTEGSAGAQPSATGQGAGAVPDAVTLAAAALAAGRIVALNGLGGFQLLVDARSQVAVQRLRERKGRPTKPFAVMVQDLEAAQRICEVPPEAARLLTSPAAPIVLLRRRGPEIAEAVAPGNPNLGVMLPYTPLHHLLLRAVGFPVVATSGNRSEEPISIDEGEALERLGGMADLFLVHDRPIERHVDDSVVWIVGGAPQLLRRARGYAPLPVRVAEPVPPILAVGAHLKNTIALGAGELVYLSQHIGDLETPEAQAAFERVIADFLRLYQVEPVAIAHDLHPDYTSTRWAQETVSRSAGETPPSGDPHLPGKEPCSTARRSTNRQAPGAPLPFAPEVHRIPVQHHHAHLASCLAEHGEPGPALGVIWDGTGYGLDGVIWGGEFLRGDARGFQRVAHLRPFHLPGGEAAVHEPRRIALALIREVLGDAVAGATWIPAVAAFDARARSIVLRMLERGFQSPVTTSAGRLFDGIAALVGLRQRISFEGEAAMALEFAVDPLENGAYPVDILPVQWAAGFPAAGPGARGASAGPPCPRQHAVASDFQGPGQGGSGPDARALVPACSILDWRPLVAAVLDDVRRGVAAGAIAARVHNGLVAAIVKVARTVGEERVVLSGGCFQNRVLTERARERLARTGLRVLLHRQVPPNDGGISLGQVVVAAARLRALDGAL